MKSARRINIHNSDADGVMIQDMDGKYTAALFAEEEINIYLKVNEDRVFKGMDYLGNTLSWKSTNGLLRIKIGMEPVYLFNVNEDFKGTPNSEFGHDNYITLLISF